MKFLAFLSFLPALAMAQVPADPAFLSHLVAAIPSGQSSAVLVTAGVVELALRLIPTDKPKNLLYGIANGLKLLGVFFTRLGELSDKVLPQRVNPPSV